MTADKVYLWGFMGAGKSTVARALARRLDWRAEDIDAHVERLEQRDIATQRSVVVATGGGTAGDPANRALMLRDGAVAWLDLPFDRVVERIPPDGRRPLAADRAEMERLYNQRLVAYQQAHARFDVSRVAVDEVVDQLVDWLRV